MSDQADDPKSDSADSDNPSRRDVLKVIWGTTALTVAGASAFIGLRYMASRESDSPFGGEIKVGLVDDFPLGTVTPFNDGEFFLIREEDGGFLALYRKCTHLDCIVLWDSVNRQFFCPCHGSVFGEDGAVQNPPAPTPLIRFPIEIDDRGRMTVDTGTLIEREVASPSDYTYPPEANS